MDISVHLAIALMKYLPTLLNFAHPPNSRPPHLHCFRPTSANVCMKATTKN